VDPVALTRQLVAVESPTGAEGPVVALLAALLEHAGYHVTRQQVSAGRDNIYAWREPPALVFTTHLDCVPPYVPLREDDEWVHGRGSCDAKGLAAAMFAAAEWLAERGERRIGLLYVVGEENGSDGAHAAAALEPKGRFLVNGEPTENRLCIAQKGSLRCDLEASGRAAHSAYPDEGCSAIEALLDTLERIRRIPLAFDPLLGPSTLNVGTIHGGVAPNVLAPSARAQVLIRTVGPTDELRAALAAAAGPRVRVSVGLEIPAYKGTAPAGWETTVVSYASDLPFYSGWGRRFQLGPGTIRVAHTEEERIRKADLRRGVELYVRLASDLLAEEAA
jgi:acetylornithine deacetylase